jgi:hypothetical protein
MLADIVVLEQPWNAASTGQKRSHRTSRPTRSIDGKSQNRRIEESYVSVKLHCESKVLLA